MERNTLLPYELELPELLCAAPRKRGKDGRLKIAVASVVIADSGGYDRKGRVEYFGRKVLYAKEELLADDSSLVAEPVSQHALERFVEHRPVVPGCDRSAS